MTFNFWDQIKLHLVIWILSNFLDQRAKFGTRMFFIKFYGSFDVFNGWFRLGLVHLLVCIDIHTNFFFTSFKKNSIVVSDMDVIEVLVKSMHSGRSGDLGTSI